MRDGREVYVGSERVNDVTTHPAFRNAAATIARLYDIKADPAHRELYSYEENGELFSAYFLQARTMEQLARRSRAHKAIADCTFGLIGRTPDHVAGMITGMAMNPSVLDQDGKGFGANLVRYYEHCRRQDIYCVFACVPPTGVRSSELFSGQSQSYPALRVVDEDDRGLVISGTKMLATGAVFADEIWIGNLIPLDDKAKKESITCALPIGTAGLSLWSRQTTEDKVLHEADYPLSFRFDETDAIAVFDRVHVPWERVFLNDNAPLARAIYVRTPANCYANHQSNVRFWSKMALIVGVASRLCQMNGTDKIPAVRETLGRLAALEAAIGAMVRGQIESWEAWPEGYACFNRRFMYAALNWCQEHHSEIIDTLRTLAGGAVLQMPASVNVLESPALRRRFEQWWGTATAPAIERMKLIKLTWDLIGSEFAGRHMLYEKFYAGNSVVMRNQSDREAPWAKFHGIVDDLLDRIPLPGGAAELTGFQEQEIDAGTEKSDKTLKYHGGKGHD
jgi:4-hydroxyphenylacetate 3-monooxygenase